MRNLRLDVFSTPWSICSQYLQETYCHRRFGVYSSLLLLAWRQGKGSSFCGEGGGSWDELRHVVEFACVVIPREEAPSFEMDNPESEKSVDLSGESRVCWKQASLEPAMGDTQLVRVSTSKAYSRAHLDSRTGNGRSTNSGERAIYADICQVLFGTARDHRVADDDKCPRRWDVEAAEEAEIAGASQRKQVEPPSSAPVDPLNVLVCQPHACDLALNLIPPTPVHAAMPPVTKPQSPACAQPLSPKPFTCAQVARQTAAALVLS
jgi:hypothetical protein